MRTRRDQVQAHRFVTRRLVSAMLSGEPETTNLPLRRLFLAVIGSAMVATVVFGAVGAWGLTHPGGNESWKKDLTLVIERESGARFIFLDGALYPVLNYASARLIIGSATPKQESASRASLAGTPRGRPVGIDGVPDALPAPKALLGLPWSVCSAPRVADTAELATHVVIGSTLTGGSPLGAEGILVTSGANTYLLMGDRRLRVPDKTALTALNLTGVSALPVGSALVEAITAGPDLAAPVVPGAGGAGKQVGGQLSTIGKVYRSGSQFYVMLPDGLATVHEVTAKLLNSDSSVPIEISAAAVAAVLSETRIEPEGLPEKTPTLQSMGGTQPAVCAGYRGDGDKPVSIEVYSKAPEQLARAQHPAVGGGRDMLRTADQVILAGGRGALVQEQPAPGVAATGTIYLVTDQGMKFALADTAQAALGYGDSVPVPVPAALLALVPTGPTLDPKAARHPVGGSS